MDRRIPVIQLIDGFATDEQSGGAAQFGIQLARHLDRARYRSLVCGLWGYGTAAERRWRTQLHDEGVETTILIEQPCQLERDLIQAAALLYQVIDRRRPRLINSHFERGDLLGLCARLVHPTQLHIVRTMHTDQQWQKRVWLGKLLNIVAFPWFFDGEVAISQQTQMTMDRRLTARWRRRRATLIYNGISSALLASPSRSRVKESTSRHAPRIVIIGRLERQKGHSDFLRAVAELLPTVPAVECWVVGAGSQRDALLAETELLGLSSTVRFLGQRSDVQEILLQADLLVSASLWEGFPTVILEAMAAQVPVIATDVSGSRELVHDGLTGLLVPVGQPAALAGAMRRMLGDPCLAHNMAERAWRHIQGYTLEAAAQSYDRLYRDLLGDA